MKDPERASDSRKVAEETSLSYVLALNGPADPHFDWSRYLPVEATLWKKEHDRNVVPLPEHPADEVNRRLQVSLSFFQIFRIVVLPGSAFPVYAICLTCPRSLLTPLLLVSHEGHVQGSLHSIL